MPGEVRRPMPHEMLAQTEGNELPNDTSNWAKVNPGDYPPDLTCPSPEVVNTFSFGIQLSLKADKPQPGSMSPTVPQ